MIRRALAVLLLGAAVAGLVQLNEPHAVAPTESSAVVGPKVEATASASTWYCPAGPGGDADLAHQLIVTNPGAKASARITGYRAASGRSSVVTTEIARHGQHVVALSDAGADIGGATVEVSGGPAVVAHRLVGPDRSDQADCVDQASDRWYFAAADTENGASARLWLLNPFATDASVDVRVSTDSFVRIPSALRGIIVPAGSSRVVELGESVQRRAQFSFAVEARGGRVAAELAQTVGGKGLRLVPGVPRTAPTWILADSVGGPNISEQVHVFNPARRDVTVLVSVTPNGTDPAAFPEPFRLEIPARRYATVDITAEARVSPDNSRWIRVDALDGAGIVVGQSVAITGPGGDGTAATRPSVPGGLASSVGSSALSTRWYVSSLDPTPDSQSVVVVANPSPDAISLVRIVRVTGGSEAAVAEKLEIPPMSSLAVDIGEASAAGPLGLEITSTTPVAVSARSTSVARADVTMWPAIPDADSSSVLAALGG